MTDIELEKVGKEIEMLMKKNDLTLVQLAKLVDISDTTISRSWNGYRGFNTKSKNELKRLLNKLKNYNENDLVEINNSENKNNQSSQTNNPRIESIGDGYLLIEDKVIYRIKDKKIFNVN